MQIDVLDWDVINLIEDDIMKLTCCGEKNNGDVCGRNATYYLDVGCESIGFCKTHLSQSDGYVVNVESKFKANETDNRCNYLKKTGVVCNAVARFVQADAYYCLTHYKSELKRQVRLHSAQPIKNLIVKKYPTIQLQLTLIKKLDTLALHFSKIGVEEVVIENQPSYKNPKMKSISNTLLDYFMIRGYIDKVHELDLKNVRFMCPSNKLKVSADNTLDVTNRKDKYKLTKELSVQYTKQLLATNKRHLEYLELFDKQDDICDAYLQGRYYLEHIKFKRPVKRAPSKKSVKQLQPVDEITFTVKKTTNKSKIISI